MEFVLGYPTIPHLREHYNTNKNVEVSNYNREVSRELILEQCVRGAKREPGKLAYKEILWR